MNKTNNIITSKLKLIINIIGVLKLSATWLPVK